MKMSGTTVKKIITFKSNFYLKKVVIFKNNFNFVINNNHYFHIFTYMPKAHSKPFYLAWKPRKSTVDQKFTNHALKCLTYRNMSVFLCFSRN